jgi:hypothetical protein
MLPKHQLCPCGSKSRFKFCCFDKPSEEFLFQASGFPVHECLVGVDAWQSSGIAMVLVSRRVVEDSFIFGMFFLDTYCLGLKDAFAAGNVCREKYLETREQLTAAVKAQALDYEDCRSLILGCVDFAKRLGFETKGDWHLAQYVIESEREYVPRFEFGKNGKPYYVQGLHDDPAEIISKLERSHRDYSIGAYWAC